LVCPWGEIPALKSQFKTVAVVARRQRKNLADTVLAVEEVLKEFGISVVFEDDTAGFLPNGAQRETLPRNALSEASDLVVVVGGDGSLLGVSRELAGTRVPIVGVNRGGLGFLAGVSPDNLATELSAILQGDYAAEDHFMLQSTVVRAGRDVATSAALNDVVVHPGSMARMIDFSLWVDGEYVYDQRSDGVIVASPTGSTAYSLSAGGPIMHPGLDAIVIVPMFPHTLTSRPLVVRGNAEIKIKVLRADHGSPQVSCDSQVNVGLKIDDEVVVNKSATPLQLIFPTGRSFYESCRSKLDWASRLGGGRN
jgi:NAD+ kinase